MEKEIKEKEKADGKVEGRIAEGMIVVLVMSIVYGIRKWFSIAKNPNATKKEKNGAILAFYAVIAFIILAIVCHFIDNIFGIGLNK